MNAWALALLFGSSPSPCPTSDLGLDIGDGWTPQDVALCIDSGSTPSTSLTSQWLAMQRLERLDERISEAESRAYTAIHRRLLMDAIHAHRGRKTPAAEHEEVLLKQPWYTPSPDYTDQLLNAVDRENLALLTHPAVPKPAAPQTRDASVREHRGCMGGYGCTTTKSVGSSWAWLWAALLFSSRRRAAGTPSARTQRAAPPHRG